MTIKITQDIFFFLQWACVCSTYTWILYVHLFLYMNNPLPTWEVYHTPLNPGYDPLQTWR